MMEILITMGKIILWFIGGITLSVIALYIHDYFDKSVDEFGMGGLLVFIATFIFYIIGTIVFFVFF